MSPRAGENSDMAGLPSSTIEVNTQDSDSVKRPYNFGPGPTAFPDEVLEVLQREMMNYKGTGMSFIEISHRVPMYKDMEKELERDMREVLQVPGHFKPFWMQGGATLQFSCAAMNFFGSGKPIADIAETGWWSANCVKHTEVHGTVNKACDVSVEGYTRIPAISEWNLSDPSQTAFMHYCSNETIHGVEFDFVPQNENVPVVADMTSNICTRAIDWGKHDLIYASCNKNCGPAGNNLIMIDEKHLSMEPMKGTPLYMSYQKWNESGGMYNTPPNFCVYGTGVYFRYMKEKGGVKYFEELSDKKQRLIYDVIDGSDGFYTSKVKKDSRSRTTIPFSIMGGTPELEKKFVDQALKQENLYHLHGHDLVGGLRACAYVGMPLEGAVTLANFMKSFAEENSHFAMGG